MKQFRGFHPVDAMRLAVVASHPVQYYAPLFRTLAQHVDLTVFYAHRASAADQASAGFGVEFEWDVDLLSGYRHVFLHNIARKPGTDAFGACDTPGISGELRSGGFDAVLVMGWYLKSFVQAIMAAKRLGMPVLVRGDSQLGLASGARALVKRLTYPALLRVFDAALYVGRRSRDYYAAYGYPSDRLFFSPHCVDTAWFASRATAEARRDLRFRHGVADDETILLFAGKLVGFKRPLDLVEAAARLREQGAKITLMFAGSGPLEAEVRQAAVSQAVHCVMLGFCNQTEMPAAYAASDILVLPSNGRETWGLVANEALACGLPILVSNEAGCSQDLCEDRSVARSFGCGDIDALCHEVLDLTRSRPALADVRRAGDRNSLSAACKGVLDALKSVSPGPTTTRVHSIG